MSKLPSRKLLASLVAGALLLPGIGYALGLGEIEVNSALNQKFNADIELLSASPEDAETLIVKLASREAFRRAGLDRPYSLTNLRFKPELINGIPYIKVSSGVPIREPFLNFLIEVDWPNGHLLREYTVLLDPPVFMTQSAGAATAAPADDDSEFRPSSTGSTNVVPVVTPSVTDEDSFRPGTGSSSIEESPVVQPQSTNSTATATYIPAAVAQQQTKFNQPSGDYRIKPGDTAWSLALAMRPDKSVSVYQMMVAMLRANPESFIKENVNGLKRGYILRVPEYEQILAISDEDAQALVREQAALWRQYQQARTGGQPVSAMKANEAAAADGSTESDINAEGSAENSAYLEILSAGAGTSTSSGKEPANMSANELRAELALARERVESERVEKEALQQRVNALEEQINKLNGMVTIEDTELSRVQSLNMPDESVPSEEAVAEPEITDESAEAEAAAEPEMVDESVIESEQADADAAEVPEEAALDDLLEQVEESALDEAEQEVFADEAASLTESEQLDDTMAAMPESEKPEIVTAPAQPRPATSPDLLTQLLNDPVRLATAGGGLLLVALLVGLIVKRRKAAADQVANGFDDLDILAENTKTANDIEDVAEISGDEVDISKESSVDSLLSDELPDIDENDLSAEVEEEKPRDDILAEADVYLAYGIYQQAEELLTKAINENPDRNDYRLKLAETHYAGKNTDGFIETATALKQHLDSGEGAIWEKVTVMGQDLCPENSLFLSDTSDVSDIASAATEDFVEAPVLDDISEAETLTDVDESDNKDDIPEANPTLDDEEFELSDLETAGEEAAAAEEESLKLDELEAELDHETATIDISDEAVEEVEFDLTEAEDITTSEDDELALDVDLADLEMETEAEPEEELVAHAPEFGATEKDETEEFDLESLVEETVNDEETVSAMDEDEEEVTLDLSDEIDVDSLDLDELEEVKPAANDAFDDEDDFDLSSLGDVDEISTKLDLARAYLDMGDSEGTRGILEEVLADGNDEQKQEANELMAKLG